MTEAGTPRISLSEIRVYPLKGAGGFLPSSWWLECAGLKADRSWMLVDSAGRCVTQLTTPRIALIKTDSDGEGVVFSAPGIAAKSCPLDADTDLQPIPVLLEGGESGVATPLDPELDAWFSAALDMECRIVRCSGEPARWVDGQEQAGAPLQFQKAFPIHLVAQASLDDLNTRLQRPVSMDRFRPNLTVIGSEPHEDDGWKRVAVGDAVLVMGRACDHRCGVPNIDQATGARGVEPLKTLATYRRSSKGIYFGQNVTVARAAEIHVGDEVSVLQEGSGLTYREAGPVVVGD